MAISIPIYFIKFWKYLHRFRASKVDGSSLNTKQLENMVSSYFQITKKPQAGWDNTSANCFANSNNWSLNVYPQLWPALCASYVKTVGKSESNGLIQVNNDMHQELIWFIDHVRNSDGVHFLKSAEWSPADCDLSAMISYVDASGVGISIWFPGEYIGYWCSLPLGTPKEVIFFFEALAVCSAIHLSCNLAKTSRLIIYTDTDNSNTFDIFNTPLQLHPHLCNEHLDWQWSWPQNIPYLRQR